MDEKYYNISIVLFNNHAHDIVSDVSDPYAHGRTLSEKISYTVNRMKQPGTHGAIFVNGKYHSEF